jgi:hypothetical protein
MWKALDLENPGVLCRTTIKVVVLILASEAGSLAQNVLATDVHGRSEGKRFASKLFETSEVTR